MVLVPPVPVVVENAVVQVVPLVDVWIWYAVAYAASQVSTTWHTARLPPRSTWIHCGSENAEGQRVAVLPSTAGGAGVPAFSVDDVVAGRPWDSRVAAALAVNAVTVR